MKSYCLRVTAARFTTLVFIGLGVSGVAGSQEASSAAKLVEHFKSTRTFWLQFEVARKILALKDPRVLPRQRDGWRT